MTRCLEAVTSSLSSLVACFNDHSLVAFFLRVVLY